MSAIKFLAAGLILPAILISPPAKAQAAYPNKPITFIVPFGAGGGFDRMARKVAAGMEKPLGQPVVIKNYPGAGGRRGSIRLFKSKADGYTIGFAHFVPFQTDEFLLGKKTAVDYKKFAIILKLTHSRHYIFVNKKGPYKSVKDLKNAGKTIKFTATGIGSIAWVEASALGATVGFPVNFITGYKSLPRAALAVAKGNGDAGVGSSHHFRGVADDVLPIVYLGNKRTAKYPNVPSILELGYPSLTALGSPRVVVAPPGTSKKHLKVLRRAVKKVLGDQGFVKWAGESGYSLKPTEPKAFWKSLDVSAGIYKSLKPVLDKAKKANKGKK